LTLSPPHVWKSTHDGHPKQSRFFSALLKRLRSFFFRIRGIFDMGHSPKPLLASNHCNLRGFRKRVHLSYDPDRDSTPALADPFQDPSRRIPAFTCNPDTATVNHEYYVAGKAQLMRATNGELEPAKRLRTERDLHIGPKLSE
jgi:hypothetical protein